MRITTVSSGFTTTQALTSSGNAGSAASAKGMWKPKDAPPATAATPARKPRREGEGLCEKSLFMSASLNPRRRRRRLS